ncbi:MAG TPA: gliding motility-associated C-terminal domain-containing protein [Flavobacteriales bacterium]|nr:gliding motility-associated C-terminal domain-containing protein [Flavobacteriales bacterium]
MKDAPVGAPRGSFADFDRPPHSFPFGVFSAMRAGFHALIGLCMLLAAVPAMAQTTVQLNEDQYEQMKAEGTLPASFHVTWSTEAPPAAHPVPATDGGSRAGGDCECWIEPDNTYTLVLPPSDDGSSSMITLPFQFNLYGELYTTCYVNNNGNVSFQTPFSTYSSQSFPTNQFKMVAPFWADVDTRNNGGTVKYKLTSNALYVNWTGVGYYNQQTDKRNTFQLIISDGTNTDVGLGSNVSFCYGDMQWTTGGASGGTNGFGGTPATVGANRGNGVDYIQFGRFDHAGTDYDGPFGANDGISWLDYKNFVFTTAVSTQNIPPIASSTSLCDTILVCTNELVDLDVNFLAPEPGQLTTAAYTITPPLNATVTETNTSPSNTANLHLQFIPVMADTGLHVITYMATDNGVPPLTSTVSVVIRILPSPELISDTLLVCDNGIPVDMLTILGPSATPGGTWLAPNGTAHTGTFNPLVDGNGDYVYSVSSGGLCPATGTATMIKVPHAHAGTGTDLAFCSWDAPVQLFPLVGGAPQNGGIWRAPDGSTFTGTLDPATAAPGTYQYIVPGLSPCPNDTALLSIAIPRSVNAGLSSSFTLCRDAAPFSMRSKLGGTPDATGQWTAAGGLAAPDLFDPATGTAGTYTYTVQATLPCPDQTATLTIQLDELPDAGLDGNLVICANGNNTPLFPLLGGTPDIGGHWLDPLGQPVVDAVLEPASWPSGQYTYVSIGPGTCAHRSDTAVVGVVINPLPVISFTADPDSGCAPLTVAFTNTTDPIYVGNSCLWTFGDGSPQEGACGSVEHTYQDAGWYHVKLKVTTPEGCTDELIAPGSVLVDPVPQATFVYTPNPGTAGNSTLVFTATDPHATTFQWTFPDGTWPMGKQAAYTFPDKLADSYPVCLYVADRYGCTDRQCDTIPILVPNLWVPNAFTPDGNGINDVFLPVMLDTHLPDYHLYIFDRWGSLVFESTDPAHGWDGTAKGTSLPSGVYVWRILYRPLNSSELAERFGTVTLNK